MKKLRKYEQARDAKKPHAIHSVDATTRPPITALQTTSAVTQSPSACAQHHYHEQRQQTVTKLWPWGKLQWNVRNNMLRAKARAARARAATLGLGRPGNYTTIQSGPLGCERV